MRALEPRVSDAVERDGLRVHYEVYGEVHGAGAPTAFLLMPDTIVHSRAWKAQIPFLARFCQVVVIDPRGNGLSDRPTRSEQFDMVEYFRDPWAVLDAIDVDRAVLVGLCSGAGQAVLMADERPDRVLGVFAINPGLAVTPVAEHKLPYVEVFDEVLDTDEGWAKLNRHYWQRDWAGFSEWFFGEMFPEPHSTKQVEDCAAWATETAAEVMLLDEASTPDPRLFRDEALAACRRVQCPVMVVSGSLDRCQDPERGRIIAEATGGAYVLLEGAGHLPNARDPVKINLLLRDFIRQLAPVAPR